MPPNETESKLFAKCCPALSNPNLNNLLTFNTWHQFKLTFAGGVTNAYVDGVPVGTSPNSPVYNLQNDWTLTLGHFDGDIDEVRISNILRQ